MKNEFTDSTSMYEKVDLSSLTTELRKKILEALEGQLQDHADDPKGYEVLRIAIEQLKSSMN